MCRNLSFDENLNFSILLPDIFTLVKTISRPIQLFIWFSKTIWTFPWFPKTKYHQKCNISLPKVINNETLFWSWVRRKTFEKWRKTANYLLHLQGCCIFLKKELEYNASAPFSFTPLWWANMLHLYILSVKWLIRIRM